MSVDSYDRNVFINCPFDERYRPLFRALLFAIVECGFNPRSALDVTDASEVRIQKIYRIVAACRLGIHDLSRTGLDPVSQLPRFNMPLELGIFLGAKFLGEGVQKSKACLVFDEQPYRYQVYLSDVAGQDLDWHKNDPRQLLTRVRDWLASLSDKHLPAGSVVWDRYATFEGELQHSCEEVKQRRDELTYTDLLRHLRTFRRDYVERLHICGDKDITNPSLTEIRKALKALRPVPDSFLILEKGANGYSYMQTELSTNGRWCLEYQNGHIDEHFEAVGVLDAEAVLQAFTSYSRGEDAWREQIAWRPLEV